jgi:DNA repair exonuclease SbcCD nuclease subunit
MEWGGAEPMVKILATADWQMDMKGGRLNEAARQYLSDTRVETIEKIIELAKEEDVAAILAAGDLFEYPSPTPEVISSVAEVLQRSKVPIHAIPGNHDLYGKSSVWETPEFRAIKHFHLHNEKDAIKITKGVTLHSIPVKSKYDTDDQDELLDDVSEEDGVHIVMAHAHDRDAAADAFGGHEDDDCTLPIRSSKVLDKGYSLLILGHWHSWREVVENRVLYPGTHEQTKFNERDAGYVAIIEVPEDGSDPKIDKVEVGKIRWAIEDFDCTGKKLPDDLTDFVRNLRDDGGIEFLKLNLTGEVDAESLAVGVHDAIAACRTLVRHLDVSTDDLDSVIDVDEMTRKVNLPMGLSTIQGSILADLENAQGNEEMTRDLMDELTALYRTCREAGII